jgi:hypothetical protein
VNLPDYRLARDTYVCLADDYLVFSNIRTDKYYCLSPAHTRIFATQLPIFQDGKASTQSRDNAFQARRIAKVLTQNRLLVEGTVGDTSPRQRRDIPPAVCSIPCHTKALQAHSIKSLAVVRFLRASMRASLKLRFWPLATTLRAVERKRHLNCRPNDQEITQIAVVTFNRLRPYYPRNYICRFDSLALIEFLAEYEQYPLWVFGVKSKPFGAHCWVQDGGLVLNDNIDYVERFTPIMAF